MYYCGIGSRKTPTEIQQVMFNFAVLAAKDFHILRSGGADGADTAFEQGCDSVNGNKEIFLPWKGFNGNKSPLYNIPEQAFEIASQIHPVWSKLSYPVQCLHARNVLQILGLDLNTPVTKVVCWTPNGKIVGGTATAIKLALNKNIQIVNLAMA